MMEKGRPVRLGEFEELILISVAALENEAYTVSIQEFIEERTGRNAPVGSVYIALERLQSKDCVRSKLGDPSPHRGGKRKKYYRITETGIKLLHQAHEARVYLWKGVDREQKWGLVWE